MRQYVFTYSGWLEGWKSLIFSAKTFNIASRFIRQHIGYYMCLGKSKGSVSDDDLYNSVEYLILSILLSTPPFAPKPFPSSSPSFNHSSVHVFFDIISFKQNGFKFENKYFVNKENFLKISEKHFWDIFEVNFLVYGSQPLLIWFISKIVPTLDICKLFNNNFFKNTYNLRNLHYFTNWNFRMRYFLFAKFITTLT